MFSVVRFSYGFLPLSCVARFWKNLAALAIGCAAALLLFEAALRIYNPLQATVKGQKIVLPAGRRYVVDNRTISKLDRTIVHTKNSLGFRGAEPPIEFANHLTLVTVGGSTTECKYLSDGNTWTDLLGRKLKQETSRLKFRLRGIRHSMPLYRTCEGFPLRRVFPLAAMGPPSSPLPEAAQIQPVAGLTAGLNH